MYKCEDEWFEVSSLVICSSRYIQVCFSIAVTLELEAMSRVQYCTMVILPGIRCLLSGETFWKRERVTTRDRKST